MGRLREGWVEFTRVPCKEGFIDVWNGDCINNPNNEKMSMWQLNSSSTYYRLNGEGEWKNKKEFKQSLLFELLEDEISDEIWNKNLK